MWFSCWLFLKCRSLFIYQGCCCYKTSGTSQLFDENASVTRYWDNRVLWCITMSELISFLCVEKLWRNRRIVYWYWSWTFRDVFSFVGLLVMDFSVSGYVTIFCFCKFGYRWICYFPRSKAGLDSHCGAPHSKMLRSLMGCTLYLTSAAFFVWFCLWVANLTGEVTALLRWPTALPG